MRWFLFVPLLVASHAFALWWGSHSPWPDASPVLEVKVVAPAQQEPTLRAIVDAHRATRSAKSKEPEDDEAREARIQAARDRIRPEDDVAAMVLAGSRNPDIEPSPETLAAYGVWLDRDPMAALEWMEDGPIQDPNLGYYRFQGEVGRHLGREGMSKLQQYLDVIPKARRSLLFAAADPLRERKDAGLTVKAVAGLASQEDRLRLLAITGDENQFRNHLGEIRGLLEKSASISFLAMLRLDKGTDVSALMEEAREAGFPPGALAALEENALPEEYEARKAATKSTETSISQSPRLFAEGIATEATKGFQPLDRRAGWGIVVPDYEEWRIDVARGVLDPAGFHDKLMQAIPGSGSIGEPVLATAAFASFKADPVKTLEWLQKTRPDWLDMATSITSAYAYELPPEVFATSFGRYQELPKPLLDRLGSSFLHFRSNDPAAYEAVFRALPEGALKRTLTPKETEGGR